VQGDDANENSTMLVNGAVHVNSANAGKILGMDGGLEEKKGDSHRSYKKL
jgi:hypothetical protein